jgi:hypothetical protein
MVTLQINCNLHMVPTPSYLVLVSEQPTEFWKYGLTSTKIVLRQMKKWYQDHLPVATLSSTFTVPTTALIRFVRMRYL